MIERNLFLRKTETTTPIVRGPEEGPAVGVLGNRSIFKVLPDETGGAYAILEQRVSPGHGPPLHVHRYETEIFYIVEGQFEFTVGGRKLAAPAGTLILGPRDIPHTFRCVGAAHGRLLLTVIPGAFANYFLEVDSVPDGDRAAIRKLCAKYEVEILE